MSKESPTTTKELKEYLDDLLTREHDYNTSAETITSALLATESLVAHILGTTGFQHGWAQLEFLAKTRHMNDGFSIADYGHLRYPQYDLIQTLRTRLNETLTSDKFIADTQQLLADGNKDRVHPDVRRRWEDIVNGNYRI